MKKALLFLSLLSTFHLSNAQITDEPETRFGWNVAPYGRMHVLVIFSEIIFDSIYTELNPVKEENGNWPEGQLPKWKNQLFSPTPDGEGFMTRYFRQASFGAFQVTGDYLDTLIRIRITDVKNDKGMVVSSEAYGNNFFRRTVIRKADAIENPRLANQSPWEEFDHWTFTQPGKPKIDSANGKFDLVMIIFRNIHCPGMGDHSGFVQTGSVGKLWGIESDMYSIFRTSNYLPETITRHEFSHMLYGGNNFHTANGGVGQRSFMATVGGYSNMSQADSYSTTWNGWDRERMGWKNPQNKYLVNCRCEDGTEVDGHLRQGEQPCPDGIYILKDFISKGDMIQIRLPHLPAEVKQQYLWLENHQRPEGYHDHDKILPKGLYAYITVGKDQLKGKNIYGGENNYLWPVVPLGNYDMEFDSLTMLIRKERANPFTGHHYFMRIPSDLNGDGKIQVTQDNGVRTEYILAKDLRINGQAPPDSYFCFERYGQFGTLDAAYYPGGFTKLGLTTNPAPVPVYSFSSSEKPMKNDNRRIYLNGLSVEVLEVNVQGEMKIKIRWDDYDVVNNVRWCGDILSKETVRLRERKEILIDQGYAPQVVRPVLEAGGKKVFAEPSILQLDSGSVMELGEKSKLILRQGSSLLVRKGARLTLDVAARIEVEPGSYIYIEEGAAVEIAPKAVIDFQEGAEHAINPLIAARFGILGPMVPGEP